MPPFLHVIRKAGLRYNYTFGRVRGRGHPFETMSTPSCTPRQGMLLLLQYLSEKNDWSTYTDDYSAFLKQYGIEWEHTEFMLYHMEQEGLIVFLGKDRYWIQMTEKGNKYLARKGKDVTTRDIIIKVLKVTGSIIGIIGTILTIIELLT